MLHKMVESYVLHMSNIVSSSVNARTRLGRFYHEVYRRLIFVFVKRQIFTMLKLMVFYVSRRFYIGKVVVYIQ